MCKDCFMGGDLHPTEENGSKQHFPPYTGL